MQISKTRNGSWRRIIQAALLLGAAAAIAAPAYRSIARRMRVKHPHAKDEAEIDEQLRETFPASDPIAPRYFEIPVNRR